MHKTHTIIQRPRKRLCSQILLCLIAVGLLHAQAFASAKADKGKKRAGLTKLPKELRGVEVKQKLGTLLDSSLVFTDHTGKKRKLGDFFDGKRPVILTLNYYRCPMLCSLQLNDMVKALRGLKKSEAGYRILTISFNHKENAKLAREKRKSYLRVLDRKDFDWTFMVGAKASIQALTKAAGFSFRYLPDKKQYAHPAVIFFLTPKGKISQYLGMPYRTRDINFALISASQGKLGSIFERLIMSCFVYNPTDGQYTPFAFGMIRLGGVVTVIVLAAMLLLFWSRERQRVEKQT